MPGPTADTTGAQSTLSRPSDLTGIGRTGVVVLGGLVALGPLTTDLYLPALPALTADLHTNPAATQLTLTFSLLGVAAGQLLFGPLSDRLGRRRPLLGGLLVYSAATLLCLLATTLPLLVAGRFLQGMAGAAGLVIGRAIARDRYDGVAVVRFLASIGLISGLAPMFAPMLGAQLLRVTTWRGTFAALGVLGLLLTVFALVSLRETLPPEGRHGGGLAATLRTIGRLLRDVRFLGLVLTSSFAFGALFAYISGSSFVLQQVYGVSPQTYSLLFGLNSFAIVGVTQLNGRLLAHRFSARALMTAGLVVGAVAAVVLLLLTGVWDLGLAGFCPPVFVMMASMGVVLPNSAAQALTMVEPATAGSASALLGVGTFLCGALVAPLSSAGGEPSALVLGAVVLGCSALAGTAYLVLCRPWRVAL
ncbi:Bcr/CflA family drug resistance efflux transporter [Kitasatospora herbaricolor]|uniref:multidrug effflux MFS transporter n=1 Tax=Kitasatospora herbaricolor TaxID=68217 RepID=UPI0017482B24|nr:multidrug effflux MFS transporter [Kitasatospora herbaricolor]MDQ0311595.1 DHA1 family bicyclomycin/chloramphenicol resistance-like MFS transporter [Kitasatospora herbaricolor]GGU95384.1 Bcr/CflA family drug resistance efflux transporter [Kitasatospora herbaricolor]